MRLEVEVEKMRKAEKAEEERIAKIEREMEVKRKEKVEAEKKKQEKLEKRRKENEKEEKKKKAKEKEEKKKKPPGKMQNSKRHRWCQGKEKWWSKLEKRLPCQHRGLNSQLSWLRP